jgi:NADPH-dependent glutamate synthase beta subunit-like oxidoreductase
MSPFSGNVTLGRDIELSTLREHYDAVVLATGLSQDRTLGIAGEDLAGVVGAGRLTRFWNDHPDAEDDAIVLGRKVVVMGNGNVALDLVRIPRQDRWRIRRLGPFPSPCPGPRPGGCRNHRYRGPLAG